MLQRPYVKRLVALIAAVLIFAGAIGSVLVFGLVALILVVPFGIVGMTAVVLGLSSISMVGNPDSVSFAGWRSTWFSAPEEELETNMFRNLIMLRGWQDSEVPVANTSLESQVAALTTEVQYLREAMQRATGITIPDPDFSKSKGESRSE